MRFWVIALISCFISIELQSQIIFHWDGGYIGDHLTSFYNAYGYAKKYNLDLQLFPFVGYEFFECSNNFPTISFDPAALRHRLVRVQNENDIKNNLHRHDVIFFTDVMSDRLVTDAATATEACSLCRPSSTLDLHYLPACDSNFTIAVHVRKGNGGVHYDGELSSEQLFDFNRSIVRYTHYPNKDPFLYFKAPSHQEHRLAIDRYWVLKFPPEQYYVDQIKKIVATKNNERIVVWIFTDDKDPLALLDRWERHFNASQVELRFYDNRHKDINMRIVEDLTLMSRCDALIRSKSGFGLIAELIGTHKSVFFPIEYVWQNHKLIMSHIIIKGQLII